MCRSSLALLSVIARRERGKEWEGINKDKEHIKRSKMGKSDVVSDLYKPHMSIYKFLFSKSAYYQHVTRRKYKSRNLDINGFM